MKRAYIVIIFALVLMLAFIFWLHSLGTVYAEGWQKYIVCSGDTIYGIAECINDGSYDTRELVYMIQEHNDISAMLSVGQVIEIPTEINCSK